MPGGIAIPHARAESKHRGEPGYGRLAPKVDFGAPDGPADIVFLIAAPAGGQRAHEKLLSALARALVRPDFVADLRSAETPNASSNSWTGDHSGAQEDRCSCRRSSVGHSGAGSGDPTATTETAPAASDKPSIVAITACPTGIAHTYMAADALKYAAERPVSSFTSKRKDPATTPFDPKVISDAGAVIFATDVGVKGKERFAGKPVIASGVKRAINEPDKMIAEAVAAAVIRMPHEWPEQKAAPPTTWHRPAAASDWAGRPDRH